MPMKVAVESNLSPVQEYLSNQGCQVEILDASKIQNLNGNNSQYAAVVISGADQNLMGMQSVQSGCPVINAHGLTPEQIYQRIQSEAK